MFPVRQILRRGSCLTSISIHKIQPTASLHIAQCRHTILCQELQSTVFLSKRYDSSNAADNVAQNKNSAEENTSGVNADAVPKETEELINVADIPDIPIATTEVPVELTELGEPTLRSLGLGSAWTPAGWVQRALEFVHVTLNIPWWGTIVIGVIAVRLLVFPIVIASQRSSIKMNNHMPRMQELQAAVTRARFSGNPVDSIKASVDLSTFMTENKINPIKTSLLPMSQAPVFISFFVGLRGMCNAPVESMTVGGLYWFKDLTLPDEYYLLPLITVTTLWVTLEVGCDMGKSAGVGVLSQYMKYGVKLIPCAVFPFIMNFPAGILVYWATTNFVSLAQVLFLRVPKVRKYFQIEELIKHNENSLPIKKKGFFKDCQESITNAKITRQIEERDRIDQMSFQRAGRSPPVKTFKHNPLLNKSQVQAKSN